MIISNAFLQPIVSINLKGKVKYGVKDKVADAKDFINKKMEGLRKAKRWLTDDMTKADAEEFFKSKKLPVKVGALKKVSTKDGGLWKILCGNYRDKQYYGFFVLRNGNDIRILKQFCASGDPESSKQGILQWYNEVDPQYEQIDDAENESTENAQENTQEDDSEEYQTLDEYNPESDNPDNPNPDVTEGEGVIYAEDDFAPREDDLILDKDDYVIYDDGDDFIVRDADEN